MTSSLRYTGQFAKSEAAELYPYIDNQLAAHHSNRLKLTSKEIKRIFTYFFLYTLSDHFHSGQRKLALHHRMFPSRGIEIDNFFAVVISDDIFVFLPCINVNHSLFFECILVLFSASSCMEFTDCLSRSYTDFRVSL